jgi:rhamnosyltransferase
VQYRQHGTNTLGARTFQKKLETWKQLRFFEQYWDLIHGTQAQGLKLLRMYSAVLTPDQRALLTSFANLTKRSFPQRVWTLHRFHLRKNKWYHSLTFWTLLATRFRESRA